MDLVTDYIYMYKYVPFNEGSLKIITEGTIKYSCPLEFNDPFDGKPFFDIASVDDIRSNRKDLFKKAGDIRGLSPAKRIQNSGKILSSLKQKISDGSLNRQMLESTGIVCLSRKAMNILMWSHYADFHKGFVLEFKIPVAGLSRTKAYEYEKFLIPLPINYSIHRPVYKVAQEDNQEGLKKYFLTKSRDWEYEAEERVIYRDKPPGIYPYHRDQVLHSVITGIKMEKADFDNLRSAIEKLNEENSLNVKLYKAKEVAEKYQLVVPDHPHLSNGDIGEPPES